MNLEFFIQLNLLNNNDSVAIKHNLKMKLTLFLKSLKVHRILRDCVISGYFETKTDRNSESLAQIWRSLQIKKKKRYFG